MSLFKCKMCGGTLEINPNETVATCEYCGTQQTLPKLDDDRMSNLYDRANHFRRNNEFDKAMGLYEQILNEDSTDAEAYWSLILCRYGIEYVEDLSSHRHIPTVNRTQYTSIFDDENYKSALQYADSCQKSIYEEEAKAINEIQKGILAISRQEEPFDVFICYKESDHNGRRTPDSVLANDLYHQLIQEGFQVFYSRITLEDKLGSAYEPYIFAALNSAKVMVVLGTRPEYFQSAWVKNEWNRYLSLIKQGQKKILIPAYKDMDPYDLPEEFSHLQAQDMSRLGFMTDLIRGVKKILQSDKPKVTIVKEIADNDDYDNVDAAPLLRRSFIFLEDGNWDNADRYCEKVLDIEPECAEAYLGKLMAELHVHKQDDLKNLFIPFDDSNNYQRAIRFADEELKKELTGYIEHINVRNENARLEDIYSRAKDILDTDNPESAYKEAAQLFESISEYKDSASLVEKCYEKAEIVRKDAILIEAKSKMYGQKISNYKTALDLLESIPGWKDTDKQIYKCQKLIEETEAKANRDTKIAIITTLTACVVIVFFIIFYVAFSHIKNICAYNDAIASIDEQDYISAYESLIALNGYRDSTEKANSIYKEYRVEKFRSAKTGDSVFLGSYEQDNDISNGKENIEWNVLKVEDEKLLVISKYALDCQPYNTIEADVTWETCTLRQWLNNEFYSTAFSEEESKDILTVTVPADPNPDFDTPPGSATEDKIFVLSIKEAEKYITTDIENACLPTEYAIANGIITYYNRSCCSIWLRSPGKHPSAAAYIITNDDIDNNGKIVDFDKEGILPAMWINRNP